MHCLVFFPIFSHVTVYQIWSWHSIKTELNVYIHVAKSGRAYGGTRMCKPEILLLSWRYSHTRESIPYTNTTIPGGHCTEFAYEACCHQLLAAAAAAAKLHQSCLTLCDPIDGRPPGSSVPGILQARTLEWVAISFSNA